MFLLDTNICIYLFKHQPPSVAKRFESLNFGDAVISAITLAELEHGVEIDPTLQQERRYALNRLLELLPVLDFDMKAAKAYGKLRARGEHVGRHRFDTLIAAHAISLSAILVTNNLKDFKGLRELKVETWVSRL
jgi:tRNA(fMet)-specific endonuclease VapC